MGDVKVAVQLIIFGERAGADLAGVLADVQAAGYAGFEGGVPTSQQDQDRMRAAAATVSLDYVGGHCGLDQLADPSLVERMAAGVKALGGAFLMVSGGADSLEGYRAAAGALGRAGELCLQHGVTLCYHNHNWEFTPMDGQRPIDLLAASTDPAVVKLCPDVYWILVGGDSPAGFLRRHPGRFPCVHFKDGLGGDQPREFRELGRGTMDLPAALAAALEGGCQWAIVEQDSTKGDPAESCRISREYLRGLGL